jgi:uncharacterized lipoprotein YddW (UPF0748 family)
VIPPPARPVTELRGVWVSDTPRLDWEEATSELQRAGFNTMYVNLASSGARLYSGGANDPVARGIELAHRRGLAVHAKVIVMFMFKAPASFQREMIHAGRVMRGADLQPIKQSGATWLCPSQLANRELVAAAVADILQRYRVDGVQFDYIRFNEQPSCFCPHCRQEFERATGTRVKRWPAAVLEGAQVVRFNEWRRQIINDWIRDLAATVRRLRPGLPASAAVFPDLDRAREEKAQDWKLWLERGDVDYVCTMTYTTDPRDFDAQIRKQQLAARSRNQIVVGIGSWKLERLSQLEDRIERVRRHGAPGFVLFSYDDAAARNFLPRLETR